jgi:predicted flap endonuclease-1-like 5' DNA nuclease
MNPQKTKRRFTFWHALLDLLAVSAVLGAYLYWQKLKKSQPALQRSEIPVELVYPTSTPDQETVAYALEATPPQADTPAPEPDDLQRIEGIGPKIAGVLNTAGITTYAQIAAHDLEELKTLLASAGVRANLSTWPEQAQLAAAGDWTALAQLQAQIKHGRRSG